MGFMDKASEMADQAQQKIEDAQKQFNESQSQKGQGEGGDVPLRRQRPADPGAGRPDRAHTASPADVGTPAPASRPRRSRPPRSPWPRPAAKPEVGGMNAGFLNPSTNPVTFGSVLAMVTISRPRRGAQPGCR